MSADRFAAVAVRRSARKGDWLVTDTGDSHVYSRHVTEADAQAALDRLRNPDTTASPAAIHAEAHDRAMRADVPDLIARQVRWQEWRSTLFETLRHRERYAAIKAAQTPSLYAIQHPAYGEAQRGKQDRAIEEAAKLGAVYGRAVALDAAIKHAYAVGDPDAYEAALVAGEALMHQHPQHGIGTPPPPVETARRDLNIIIVRGTAAERERVKALADEAGMNVSDFVRARIGL